MHTKSLQFFLTLCNSMDCSPQAPLSKEFSRQEYWSGLPCPPPRDLPDPGIEPAFLTSPALASRFFTTSATWKIVFNSPASHCPPTIAFLSTSTAKYFTKKNCLYVSPSFPTYPIRHLFWMLLHHTKKGCINIVVCKMCSRQASPP